MLLKKDSKIIHIRNQFCKSESFEFSVAGYCRQRTLPTAHARQRTEKIKSTEDSAASYGKENNRCNINDRKSAYWVREHMS